MEKLTTLLSQAGDHIMTSLTLTNVGQLTPTLLLLAITVGFLIYLQRENKKMNPPIRKNPDITPEIGSEFQNLVKESIDGLIADSYPRFEIYISIDNTKHPAKDILAFEAFLEELVRVSSGDTSYFPYLGKEADFVNNISTYSLIFSIYKITEIETGPSASDHMWIG